MPSSAWTPADTERAKRIWEEYQRDHDVSARKGQAVGIDPSSGRIWFGDSDLDIALQRQAEGAQAPLYILRVGRDHYGLKVGKRKSPKA